MKLPNLAIRPLVALLLLLPTLAACSAAGPNVELRGETFRVELADDPQERAMGMMFRDHLDADAGMLFLFRTEEPRSFWMKNCRINLDILYFDEDWRLVNGHFNVPPCRSQRCPSYESTSPARYVLELNGGTAERLGVRPGDVLTANLPERGSP